MNFRKEVEIQASAEVVFGFHERPDHYGAAHFHEDDLTDAQWRSVLELDVPQALPSGQYALKLDFELKPAL